MPSAAGVSRELDRELRRIDRARQRAEAAWPAAQNRRARLDLERVYGGLFVGAVIAFERFLEDLFVGLLVANERTGLASARPSVVPHVRIASHRRARELLLDRPDSYVNWLPYERTEGRALVYFRSGRPFTDSLTTRDRNQLARVWALRNALAHRSRRSLRVFTRTTLDGLSLAPRDKEPARYLRAQLSAAPPRTRFEGHLIELSAIGQSIAR